MTTPALATPTLAMTAPAGPAPAAPAPTPGRPGLALALRDSVALTGRALRRSARTPDTLIMGVALPVMILLLFVYVFGGAISSDGAYVTYVVPGIVLLCAGYGAATTAVSVAHDVNGGLLTRLRSMPVRPASVLTSHVVESVVRNAVSTLLVLGVASLIGFRPTASAGEWLAAAGLVGLYLLALTWLAVTIGVAASGPEGASAFSFVLMFIPYVSSAFVQPSTMPAALEWVARYQPVTPVTDTLRAWLVGAPGANVGVALAWCVGGLLVARLAAVAVFRRRLRG